MADGWCRIKRGAEYSDVAVRTFRDWLKGGLKHTRLPSPSGHGTILIKYEWIDEFLENFAVKENQVDEIVTDTMKDFR